MYKYVVTFRSPGGVVSDMFIWADDAEQAAKAGEWIYEGWTLVSSELVK